MTSIQHITVSTVTMIATANTAAPAIIPTDELPSSSSLEGGSEEVDKVGVAVGVVVSGSDVSLEGGNGVSTDTDSGAKVGVVVTGSDVSYSLEGGNGEV